VLVAGDYGVELVAQGGEIHAFVFDAHGKAHAQGDLELSLSIDGAPSLKLEWDAPSLSYRAKLAAGLDLSMKPIRVTLVAAGRAHVGAVAGLSADARLHAGASAKADLDAKANLDAKAKADVGAKAGAGAQAKASLAVPKPKIEVKAKAPTVKAEASTKKSAGAKASGKAGFSLGTK
jgi:hypothetical protein